ncbi:MAG: hypothetical protein KME14_26035 [Tildeniella torsiva UHER 1998/13D]|jgi:hypothetical protein|nr:hypothetical protein [Tildeniella torsiva UHER 1998/13D]
MARPKSKSILMQIREFLPPSIYKELDGIAAYFHLPDMRGKGPGHAHALSQLEENWYAALFWVAYKMFPAIDVYRSPYLGRLFQVVKEEGYELWYWLHLCEGCWDNSPEYRKFYRGYTPLSVWGLCMREFKQNEAEAIMGGMPNAPLSERKQNGSRLLMELAGADPFADKPPAILTHTESPHTDRLIKTAISLKHSRSNKSARNRKSFAAQYYQPLVEQIRRNVYQPAPINSVVVGVRGEGWDAALVQRKGKSELPVKIPQPAWLSTPHLTLTKHYPDGTQTVVKWRPHSPMSREEVYVKPEKPG